MKYKIITFRGLDYAKSHKDAREKAKELIREISQDGFDSCYWWARIEDTQSTMFEYVYCSISYGCRTTGRLLTGPQK